MTNGKSGSVATRVEQFNSEFGLGDELRFAQTPSGLIYAQVKTAAASATVFLQGAHVTAWQPTGAKPVLFTSSASPFEPGVPIRGGVPLVFPWFGFYGGDKREGVDYPQHGPARISEWTLAEVERRGDALALLLQFSTNDAMRSTGFAGLSAEFEVVFGRELTMEMRVHNANKESASFEDALHTYFAVGDITMTTVEGLRGLTYLDKTADIIEKVQTHDAIPMGEFMDSVYLNTDATCVIHDHAQKRSIRVAKSGSKTTVVWNPGAERCPKVPGLAPEDWKQFLCVETANANRDALTIKPGATHHMRAEISVT
jgi:glucose-6-phosphate 1-epimerase